MNPSRKSRGDAGHGRPVAQAARSRRLRRSRIRTCAGPGERGKVQDGLFRTLSNGAAP